MIVRTEWKIEGLNPEGDWVMLDRPLMAEDDHLERRDLVVRTLRERGVTRYSKVRLAKYVTTAEIAGEDIPV